MLSRVSTNKKISLFCFGLLGIGYLLGFLINPILSYYVPIIFGLLISVIIDAFDAMAYFNRKVALAIGIGGLGIMWILNFTQTRGQGVDWLVYYILLVFFTLGIIVAIISIFKSWNKIENVLDPYDNVLGVNPNDTISLNNKGVELTNLKRFKWALECFDKVLELEPEDAAALHNKGVLITKLEKTRTAANKANEYFDRALKSDPGFENAKRSGKIILES
jgi:tetratricopeptide (TPR) repeat protein